MNPQSADGEEEVLAVSHGSRWLPVLLVVVFVAAVVVLVLHKVHQSGEPTAATTPTSTRASRTPASVVPAPRPVIVTDLGHPILGATGTEELFGRGPGVVVRIELARGRVTTTTVPMLNSSGPVSFVVTRHEAIVRPLDLVSAYEVPDGQPAHEFSGPLSDVASGPIFPGPDGNSIWAESNNANAQVLRQVRLDGRPSRSVLQMPRGVSSIAGLPDGSGYVAFSAAGGSYDSVPTGLRRVSTGSVIAVGSSRWLTRSCDAQGSCPISVVDPHTGASRVVARSFGDADVIPGVVSPDGTAACVIVVSPSPVLLHVDLRTGAETALPLSLNSSVDPRQSLVWSLDSRWLFALDAAGELHVVDARTLQITDFRAVGPALSSLTQLAIR